MTVYITCDNPDITLIDDMKEDDLRCALGLVARLVGEEQMFQENLRRKHKVVHDSFQFFRASRDRQAKLVKIQTMLVNLTLRKQHHGWDWD